MSYRLIFTESYNRRAAKRLSKHPDLETNYLKTLLLLQANPHHPSLRLHALSGRLAGLHSISINLAQRITLELMIRDQEVVLVNVGSHDEVYR
jgi:mRNA-degrading endonuclease YafQ of YafQ-DinJ toxin-antitoxin module